jgi:hypothetical protein
MTCGREAFGKYNRDKYNRFACTAGGSEVSRTGTCAVADHHRLLITRRWRDDSLDVRPARQGREPDCRVTRAHRIGSGTRRRPDPHVPTGGEPRCPY